MVIPGIEDKRNFHMPAAPKALHDCASKPKRADDGCIYEGKALRGHESHSRKGKQGHRAAVDRDFSCGWDYRLAAWFHADWEAGFRFSPPADCRVCGRVLLARVSLARHLAKNNAGFWRTKILGNRRRDRAVDRALKRAGWRVVRVWEHALTKKHAARTAARLKRLL